MIVGSTPLDGLFEIVDELEDGADRGVDREVVARAFAFAEERRAATRDASVQDALQHPVHVATISAHLWLDTTTLCAALLREAVGHGASSETLAAEFGEEVVELVDGVTKLSGLTYAARDEAESYRAMLIATATDIRVILIKIADRLQAIRLIDALPKQQQIETAREVLSVYAPIAHRLGIHALKLELEDRAFETLYPRKYAEITELVEQQLAERERYVDESGAVLAEQLRALEIEARISGRAKHFYSIYAKMTRKGREFNEIHDIVAMRVLVDSVKHCYGAVGVIHSLWKPLPGRFKDFVAMPKFNLYQSLHTTVIGPEGRALEIQIRTPEMHERAEGLHWFYKRDVAAIEPLDGFVPAVDLQERPGDPRELMTLLGAEPRRDAVRAAVVSVTTPRGGVVVLPAGATPVDFAYAVHSGVGDRCVGAKVDGRIVPLAYELRSGERCEIVTAAGARPREEWLASARSRRARRGIHAGLRAVAHARAEDDGRALLRDAFERSGLADGDAALAPVARELGFTRGADLFAALGEERLATAAVVSAVERWLALAPAAEPGSVGVQVVGWHRSRLLDELLGAVVAAGGATVQALYDSQPPAVRVRLVVDCDDRGVDVLLARLRAIDSVFEAHRDEAA